MKYSYVYTSKIRQAFFADTILSNSPFLAWDLNITSKTLPIFTVEPCTLAQSDYLWGLVVTKPMILSTKVINMT